MGRRIYFAEEQNDSLDFDLELQQHADVDVKTSSEKANLLQRSDVVFLFNCFHYNAVWNYGASEIKRSREKEPRDF